MFDMCSRNKIFVRAAKKSMPKPATFYPCIFVTLNRGQIFVILQEKSNFKTNNLMKILMVCLGNICRSPLAEGIMQHKIAQRQLGWQVDSAGTGNWHIGELPDRRSIAVARKYGIDITNQRARQFSRTDFLHFDLIFAMDHANYRDLLHMAPDPVSRDKVQLILEAAHGQHQGVPDPYYDDAQFEPVFRLLNDACDTILERIAPALV